jgi:hypothetical protein
MDYSSAKSGLISGLDPTSPRRYRSVDGRLTVKLARQGGGAMTLALPITLLVMLVSFPGCASQIPHSQASQLVAERAQEEQPKKPAIPTFTYRPGM